MENLRGMPGMLDFTCDSQRLKNGNTLIVDAGDETEVGSEVLEVNFAGQIVWRYGEGLRFAHSAKRLKNGNTLITDTHHNRLIEVTPDGKIAFTSEEWGKGSGRLSDGSHLHYPNDAHLLDDQTFLITDRNNDRCIIVDRAGNIKWFYNEIKHPHNADPLPNGNIIIADSDNNRIIEVNRNKQIVWEYGTGDRAILNWPRDADRLENGNTLITDSKNGRIIEVTPEGQVVWSYEVPYFPLFYCANKLDNGNVLISDQQHRQVIEVDPYGNVVWMFRNYRFPEPIYPRLRNGFFKETTPDNQPKYWVLNKRVSEGGGVLIWDRDTKPNAAPGLELDRPGGLFLHQQVAVKGGRLYKMAGRLRAELKDGSFAYFQTAFLDSFGGFTQDAASAPKGRLFTFFWRILYIPLPIGTVERVLGLDFVFYGN